MPYYLRRGGSEVKMLNSLLGFEPATPGAMRQRMLSAVVLEQLICLSHSQLVCTVGSS